jgi:hypothetical protein
MERILSERTPFLRSLSHTSAGHLTVSELQQNGVLVFQNYQTGGQEQKCCWACVSCAINEFLLNDTTCQACPMGFLPNGNKTGKLQVVKPEKPDC